MKRKKKIIIKVKRKFKTSNFDRGKAFEIRVRNKFLEAGWGYAKRKWGSLGVEDIVCIKDRSYGVSYGSLVALPQCKFGLFAMQQYKEKDKQKLRDLANKCGAIPIYAYSLRRKIHMIDLNTGKEFIP